MISLFTAQSSNETNKKWTHNQVVWFMSVLFIVTTYAVIGNAFFAEGSALHVSNFTVSLLGKYAGT